MLSESSRCSHRRVSASSVFVWAKWLCTRISILTTAPSSLMISFQGWTSNRSEISAWHFSGEAFILETGCDSCFVQTEDNSRRQSSRGDSDQAISGGIPGHLQRGADQHQHLQNLSLSLAKLSSSSRSPVLSVPRQAGPGNCLHEAESQGFDNSGCLQSSRCERG